MLDLTLCGHECPVAHECYRHKTHHARHLNEDQWWVVWPEDHVGSRDCSLYWSMDESRPKGKNKGKAGKEQNDDP